MNEISTFNTGLAGSWSVGQQTEPKERESKVASKANPQIRENVLKQVEEMYDKHSKTFFRALEDAESKRLNMNFTATIDLSDAAPVITTEVSFKDKATESGMAVNKTFSASTTDVLDDPTQPELVKVPRKKKGKSDGDAAPEETEGE